MREESTVGVGADRALVEAESLRRHMT